MLHPWLMQSSARWFYTYFSISNILDAGAGMHFAEGASWFICLIFCSENIKDNSKGSVSKLRRARLYEDRDTVVGFPSQKCQCVLWPPGSCTRDFALFQMSSPTGPLLTCLRMRLKVSIVGFKCSYYCTFACKVHLENEFRTLESSRQCAPFLPQSYCVL